MQSSGPRWWPLEFSSLSTEVWRKFIRPRRLFYLYENLATYSLSCERLRSSDKECISSDHFRYVSFAASEFQNILLDSFGRVRQSPKVAHTALLVDHNARIRKKCENLLAKTLPHSSLISHLPCFDTYLLYIPCFVSLCIRQRQNDKSLVGCCLRHTITCNSSSILGNVAARNTDTFDHLPLFAPNEHANIFRRINT